MIKRNTENREYVLQKKYKSRTVNVSYINSNCKNV